MKVLHISSAKTIRGGEHQIKLLIKELSLLGITNLLLCPLGSDLSKEKIEGLEKLTTYVKFSPANILVSAFIRKLAVNEDVDIIHLHDPHSHQFAFFSYKLFSNPIPAVVTRRVSFPVKQSSRAYYTHPMIKKVICVSNSVNKSLSNLKLNPDKCITIPSGTTLVINHNKLSIRERFDISDDTKLVVNLAAISGQKDYKTFILAAHELINKYDHKIIFLIIGRDDGLMKEMKKLADDLSIADQVIFTGYIPEASTYLPEVDVLLSTSVSEGLGNTVSEAMKYGVPVVATNCEGTRDLIEDRVSGLLANIGDYEELAVLLNKVLLDNDLCNRLTHAAFETIRHYDIKLISKSVLDLYQSIVVDKQNI